MEPAANWFQYLPLMAKVHDPTLYPRDDFVPLLVEKTPSWFYWLLGKLLPTENPYPHLFILNLLTRLVSGALIYAIAKQLARDWRAGWIAVFLLSGQADTVLGRGDINWPYFTHTAMSIPLILLSLSLLLRQRWYAAFATAGLLWNVHLLNAAYYGLFLLFWLLLRREAVGWKRGLVCAGLAVLLAAPVLPRILSGLSAPAAGPLWMEHATSYHKRLLSPFEQPLEAWVRFGGYLFLFLLMVRRQSEVRTRSIGAAMILMWAVLYALGVLFVRLFPLPLFLKFQPFRCTDVFLLPFFAWLSADLLKGFTSRTSRERILHFGLLALVYFFNLRINPSPLTETFTFLWTLLVLLKGMHELFPACGRSEEGRRLSSAVAWGSILFLLALLFVSNHWFAASFPWVLVVVWQRHLLLTSLLFFIAAAYLVRRLPSPTQGPNHRRLKTITVCLLVLLGIEWSQRAVASMVVRRSRTGHFLFERFRPAFYEAARWCRSHTPRDTLFITPPYRGGFRSESLRSVLVSWDEQLVLWIAPEYVREYDRRLHLLGFEPYGEGNPSAAWHPTHEQILKVRDEFDADYLVIETSKLMPFPILYSNVGYTVYRLK